MNTIKNLGDSHRPFNKSDKDIITQLVDAGYTLTPLIGKKPVNKDWVNTIYDPLLSHNEIKGNYGVVLRDDDLIIDIDPRNFPKDDKPHKRLLKDLGIKLESFTVKTGGGGLHIYMKKPADLKIRGGLPEYPGVEFKTKGQQVVGVGSLHPDTKKYYSVVKLSPAEVKPAPPSLLELIKRSDTFSKPEKGLADYTDDSQSAERFKQFLLNCRPAIEGENGDATTLQAAHNGRDFGLSPEKTFELMAEYFNPRCLPQWGIEELQQKVGNAYTYATNKLGSKNPISDFEGVKISDPANDKKVKIIKNLMKPITEATAESKELNFIVENMFARSAISFVASPPGTGKTQFAMGVGRDISSGGSFLSKFIKPHKVLMLEGDMTTSIIKSRVNGLRKQPGDNFQYLNRFDADTKGVPLQLSCKEGRSNFESILKEGKPDFIILDTLISFIDSENDLEKLKPIVDFLRCKAAEFDCHIMIIHHVRKRSGNGGREKRKLDQDDMIGSSIMQRMASCIILLEKYESQDDNILRVRFTCAKTWFKYFKPFDMLIKNSTENGKEYTDISFVEPLKEETAIEGATRQILEFFAQSKNTKIAPKEIKDKLPHLSETSIKQALNSLVNNAYISTEGATKNKKYWLNTDDYNILADT